MSDDRLNPPIVLNLIGGKEFGGFNLLREISCVRTDNGKWSVRCKPVLKSKGFSFGRVLFPWLKDDDSGDDRVFDGLIEKGCRIESDGSGDEPKVVIYNSGDPSGLKSWFLAGESGLLLQIAREVKLAEETLFDIKRKYDLSEEQLKRVVASGGVDNYLFDRVLENNRKARDSVGSFDNFGDGKGVKKKGF